MEKAYQNPDLLMMKDIPESIRTTSWDVVLVDAPKGSNDESPGRMKSIYEASRLVRPGGHVFVHDTDRVVEAIFSSTYLLDKNLVSKIQGSEGQLSHYWIRYMVQRDK